MPPPLRRQRPKRPRREGRRGKRRWCPRRLRRTSGRCPFGSRALPRRPFWRYGMAFSSPELLLGRYRAVALPVVALLCRPQRARPNHREGRRLAHAERTPAAGNRFGSRVGAVHLLVARTPAATAAAEYPTANPVTTATAPKHDLRFTGDPNTAADTLGPPAKPDTRYRLLISVQPNPYQK